MEGAVSAMLSQTTMQLLRSRAAHHRSRRRKQCLSRRRQLLDKLRIVEPKPRCQEERSLLLELAPVMRIVRVHAVGLRAGNVPLQQ